MDIPQKIKEIIHRYDPLAEIFLFGSRARGDFSNESDWDFLVLLNTPRTEALFLKIREDVLNEIEWKTFDVVQTIVKNKKEWMKYQISDLHATIRDEGKRVA